MNIEIKLLTECPEHLHLLSTLGYNEISRHWNPNASIEGVTKYLQQHLNKDKMPMTFVALFNDKPIGMASLREDDGLGTKYSPWLGSLVVDSHYRQQKIAQRLIAAVKLQAKTLGFKQLYLLAFDKTIPEYYAKLGWQKIDMDTYWGHPVTIMLIHL